MQIDVTPWKAFLEGKKVEYTTWSLSSSRHKGDKQILSVGRPQQSRQAEHSRAQDSIKYGTYEIAICYMYMQLASSSIATFTTYQS